MTPDVAQLPVSFRPVVDVPLVRLGRNHDGGYLVDSRNLDHADLLVGMGINTDWSFEEDFLARRPVPLLTYDGTASAWEFFVAFYKRVVLFEPANAWRDWRTLFRFVRFFRPADRRHNVHHVGEDRGRKMASLDTVVARDFPATCRNVFLKADIEGGEYHMLDALVRLAPRLEGLVVEFHDVDRNLERISRFIAAFPLALCHVHVNNSHGVTETGLPVYAELSFTRRAGESDWNERRLHPLDQPCLPDRPEIGLKFR